MSAMSITAPHPSDASQQPAFDAVLEARGLRKSYGALEVLCGVSLSVRRGEVLSIIGASGSGKSTFLRCMNLLEQPGAGQVRLAGQTVFDGAGGVRHSARKLAAFRARMPMVFQDFALWSHMSVLQNVMAPQVSVLGRGRAEARDISMSTLERVGIADKAEAYPQQLSGGQQQRAGIARALAMRPEVILFDEPTSALDPERKGEVLQVMRGLADGATAMVVVTHEMRFARDVSSRVVFFHGGRVVEEGSPAQVFDRPRTERCAAFLASNR